MKSSQPKHFPLRLSRTAPSEAAVDSQPPIQCSVQRTGGMGQNGDPGTAIVNNSCDFQHSAGFLPTSIFPTLGVSQRSFPGTSLTSNVIPTPKTQIFCIVAQQKLPQQASSVSTEAAQLNLVLASLACERLGFYSAAPKAGKTGALRICTYLGLVLLDLDLLTK